MNSWMKIPEKLNIHFLQTFNFYILFYPNIEKMQVYLEGNFLLFQKNIEPHFRISLFKDTQSKQIHEIVVWLSKFL